VGETCKNLQEFIPFRHILSLPYDEAVYDSPAPAFHQRCSNSKEGRRPGF
jgi:hypothetical protein